MPAQKGNSSAFQKLKQSGAAKAFDAHKGDETDYGKMELPVGINNGVAQLVDARIDEYKEGANKGQPFLLLSGVVVEPTTFAGEKTEGRRVTKTIKLFKDSFDTLEGYIAKALNEMRKMGVDTKGLKLDDWEAALEALVQESPYFGFRTWAMAATAQEPSPRTQYHFKGKIENYSPGEAGGGVDDQTGDGSQGGDDSGEVNWDDVGQAADAGDQDAIKQITDTGLQAGIEADVLSATNTWSEAAQLVKEKLESGDGSGDDGSGEDTSAGEQPWVPNKDDIFKYKPAGAKKAEDCQVTAVFGADKGKGTVSLKRVRDGQTFTKVPWTSSPDTLGGVPV